VLFRSLGEQGLVKEALRHFKKALAIDSSYDMAKISKEIAQKILDEKNENSKTVSKN